MILILLSISYSIPAGTATAAGNTGLSPEEDLTLTYAPSFTTKEKETFKVKKEGEFAYLVKQKGESATLTYYEDGSGFSAGIGYLEEMLVTAPKNLKQGSVFMQSDQYDDYKVWVESTTKTIKVKAGTFKNTVILKYPDGSRVYLAKGVGILKMTDPAGKVITELAGVKAGK